MSGQRLLGIAAITLTSLLWGTTGTAATFAPGVGPLAIGAAALGIGGILQAVIAVPALSRSRTQLFAHGPTVLCGAVSVAIYPLAFYSSMHLAGVAVGSVVSLASAPIASAVLERVVDGTRLTRTWLAAVTLGVAGSILLCAAKLGADTETAAGTLLGILVGLVAGATYAIYSWASRRLMVAGVPRSAAMGSVFGLGGLLLLPVLALTGAPLLASTASVTVAAYMALVPMFLGYVLFGYGLTKVSASTATTVTLIEPAVATVLAVVIVGERLPALGWLGLGAIGAALLLLVTAPGGRTRIPSVRAPSPLPPTRTEL